MKGTEPRLSHPVSLRRISPRGPGSARCDGTGDGKRRDGQGRLTGWAVSDSRFGLTEGPEEEYCRRQELG